MQLIDYLYEVNAELERNGEKFLKPNEVDLAIEQINRFNGAKVCNVK